MATASKAAFLFLLLLLVLLLIDIPIINSRVSNVDNALKFKLCAIVVFGSWESGHVKHSLS